MNTMLRLITNKVIIAVISTATLTLPALAQAPSPDLAGEGEPANATVNALCPVTTDEEIDPRFTVEYEGQTIGLCCRKCRTKFEADPEAYAANILRVGFVPASDPAQADEPDHDDGHEHADTEPEEGAADHDETPDAAAGQDDDHEEGEEHEHDHGVSESKLIAWLGNFHPASTHLPIGLLIGAALAELLFFVTKRDLFRHAGSFCVGVAAFGAIATASLGWFNGGFALTDNDWVQTTHRWLGTSTALLTLITFGMLLRVSRPAPEPRPRTAYRAALFLTVGVVSATGFFGGALVYGLNHYAW